jgi:transposase
MGCVGLTIAAVDAIDTDSPIEQAKLALARDLVADLQRIDAQRRDVKRRVAAAVTAAHSSITDVYGVGPIVAATVLGQVRDIRRFPSQDGSPPTTAPRRSRSPPVTGSAGCPAAETANSTMPFTWSRSARSATATTTATPTTSANAPKG